MIFVTVGSQMPFDRMISIVDEWAVSHSGEEVIAQIGNSVMTFDNITCVKNFSPSEYIEKIKAARIVIGHVGMGTILTCRDYKKPLIVMPRRGDLKETRNDHQIATLNWVKDWDFVKAFDNVEELTSIINNDEFNFNRDVDLVETNELAESIKKIIDDI